MNSTDEKALGQLFDEVLLPIATRMRAAGVQAFPLQPDVSWLSYYVRRKRSAMAAADFSAPACADGAELAQRLAAHWQALGRHELAAEAARFAQVAAALKSAREASDAPADAPSPYIYAMF